MKSTVKNKIVLGVALSAAFAPTRLENAFAFLSNAATQGDFSTTISPIVPTQPSDRFPQETGFEPFSAFGGNSPTENCPNGVCPSGNCPFVPRALPPTPDATAETNPAVRSVARVYNAYRETLPATGTAAGTMRRDVIEKGSGAFVADSLGSICVLTAAHIFRDGRGAISVESVDGRKFSATLEFASDEYDVALLRLDDARADVPTLSVSQSWPKQGDRVWRAGFGPNETLKTSFGIVDGYVKTSRNDSYETLKISGVARQGDSGGPICNESGEIVGVLWGTDGVDVYATYSVRILKTLTDYSDAFFRDGDKAFAEKTQKSPESHVETPIDSRLNPAQAPFAGKTPGVESLEKNRSTVLDQQNAARAALADNPKIRSFQSLIQNWIQIFWNGAIALALFIAVGRRSFSKTKDLQSV